MLTRILLVLLGVAFGPLVPMAPGLTQIVGEGPADEAAREFFEWITEDIARLEDPAEVERLRADIDELAPTLEGGERRWLAELHYFLGTRLDGLHASPALREREFREARDQFWALGLAGLAASQNHATALQELGRWDEAIAELSDLRTEHEKLGRPDDAAEVRLNLANTLFHMGRRAEALDQLSPAIELFRAGGDSKNLVKALMTRSSCLREGARFAEAVSAAEEATRVASAGELDELLVMSLTNLGHCLAAHGQQEAAVSYYLRARDSSVKNGQAIEAAMLDSSLGSSYQRLGDLAEARARVEAALEVLRPDVDGSAWRTSMFHLASILELLEGPEPALVVFAELDRWAHDHGDLVLQADVLQNQASIHEQAGALERAAELLHQALELNVILGRPIPCAEIEEGLGNLDLLGGEPARALTWFSAAAVRIEDVLRRQVMSLGGASASALRVAFRRTLSGALASLAALDEPDEVSVAVAYRVLETFHGASFVGMLAEGRSELPDGVSEELQAEVSDSLSQLEALELERAEVLRSDPQRFTGEGRGAALEAARPALDRIQARIVEQTAHLARLEERVRAVAGYHAAVDYLSAATLDEVRAALPPRTLLIEYAWGEEHVHAFALGAEGARHARLMPSVELSTKLRKTLDLVREGDDAEALPLFSELGRALLSPLLVGRDVDTLIVAPDGDLCLLPFELLRAVRPVAAGERTPFLVEELAVSYVHSGTVLRELARTSMPRPALGRTFLGMGDPRLQLDDAGPDSDPDPGGVASGGRLRGAALEVVRAAQILEREEAESAPWATLLAELAADFDAHPDEPLRTETCTVVLGSMATEHFLKADLDVGDAEIVHLGCHGVANAEFPELSSLHLAPDEHEDGVVTLREFSRLRLSARLLVLSACETQAGALLAFEGLSSFARAALQAGAGSVLATSWRVGDQAAGELMAWFYEELRRQPESLATALAMAKRRAIDERRSMRDWAGYVLWELGSTP